MIGGAALADPADVNAFINEDVKGIKDIKNISEFYSDGLKRLKRQHMEHPSGRDFTNKHSDLIDQIVKALVNKALGEAEHKDGSAAGDIAVIALGSYGRRELCPFSDIDIMVLHRMKDKAKLKHTAEGIFYPLWDLGLQVGHGTRTLKETLNVAATDIEVQTSILDGRLVAGSAVLFANLQERTLKQLRSKGGKRFLQGILRHNGTRHKQYGQTAYLLEPDIKEGEGGLRDIHAILWAAKGLLGYNSLTDFVAGGYLTEFDVNALEKAFEFLLLIRNHLHYITGRENDRLFFEYQEEISKLLGLKSENGISGTERFMRSFYTHASTIELIARSLWDQLENKFLQEKKPRRSPAMHGSKDGLVVSDGKLSLSGSKAILEQPGLEIRLFKRALIENLSIDYKNLGVIRNSLKDNSAPATWTQEIRDDFIDILKAGEAAIPTLETMDYLEILSRYIPEWSHVRCLPQYDSYHLFTVDMHMFLTVAEVQKIGSGAYDKNNPLLKQIYEDIEHKDLLLVATLLHDIGKGSGKGHSKRGARIAKEVCTRMGLESRDVKTVSFLVGNHLLLSDMAMRRDLNDENMIIDLAAAIVHEERLKMLYLISIADSLATGPKAWDTWKDNLLRELFSKVLHIINSGEYTSKKSIGWMRKTATKAKTALLNSYPEEEIDLFMKEMPHSYLLAQSSEDIIEHFELMRNSTDDISVTAKKKEGVCELTVVAHDRPGLFSKVSGALALNGVNILGAQVYTRANGAALDIFKVEGYFEDSINEDKLKKIRLDIKRALDGKIALEYRITEKAKNYQAKDALRKPPEVEINNSSSDFYTIIEVHAQDRVGLLYKITRVMFELNLDIHLAKVSTNVDKVIDVFYVWDTYGQKLSDEEQISDIKRAIIVALN